MNTIDGYLDINDDGNGSLEFDDALDGSLDFGNIIYREGTNNYDELVNKPSIEGVELKGNVLLHEIKVNVATEHDIDKLFYG